MFGLKLGNNETEIINAYLSFQIRSNICIYITHNLYHVLLTPEDLVI